MIKRQSIVCQTVLNAKLPTRRDIAREYPRLRKGKRGKKRRKRKGIEYRVACRMVKSLLEMGFIRELPIEKRSRRGHPLIVPITYPSKRVIVAKWERTDKQGASH